MARIRTIKPEFFRHEGLFEAEKESGLPLRLAFAGLWTAADREGRFKWKPRELKLDCLPHDEIDFSRVLVALLSRGFLVKYEVDGREYGYIPSWHDHQIINNRESASTLPEPNENNALTCEPRVEHATSTPLERAQGEGKGRERKGKENSRPVSDRTGESELSRFDEFWKAYPKRDGDNPRKPAEAKFNALVKTGLHPQMLIDAIRKYAIDNAGKIGTPYIPQAQTWLNQQRWTDHAAVAALAQLGGEAAQFPIEDAVKMFAKGGYWSRYAGPAPGLAGCKAPDELLAKYGLLPDGRKMPPREAA
ncbi:hypothetical protein [Bradyrhizobium genosp. A]|uniref:hypothetical protein n=1 Tax=Bradyrhizobium genosp. A TaxID=83626 RepID=UPI003CFACD44